MSKVVLSGMQPSGILHLGNYIGGIMNWKKMISENPNYTFYFMLADLHALTTQKDPVLLRNSIMDTISCYMGCGIDFSKTNIKMFQQSRVVGHSQLAWIFQTITPLGWMQRMTQFKDKSSGKKDESINLGLLSYPTLMAADILLYNANFVPTGEDQKQHIELARDIALKFNREYNCNEFTIPEPIIMEGSRIMSLTDGSKKMSKSDPSNLSRINLIDSNDEIIRKIKKAKTDSIAEIYYDKLQRPEISNLIQICALIIGESIEETVNYCKNFQTGKFKEYVADVIISKISPIRESIINHQNVIHNSKINDDLLEINEFVNNKINNILNIIGL